MKFEVPEGATPIDDADGLIPEAILTYRDLCAVEAENILHAADKHLSRRKGAGADWLDEPFLRRLHSDMFGEVWEWAGRYRQVELNIGVAPPQIPAQIGKLVGDLKFWRSLPSGDMSVLERAVRLHHGLVYIHPFRNGNGRHARMAADIYLHSQKHPLPAWPGGDLASTSDIRRRYIDALKSADVGDFTPLTHFIGRLLPGG